MLNLNDLKITPNWRVRKIGFLSAIESLPGNIFIDCGGTVKAGILDANDSSYKSAAELLFHKPELAFNHLLRGLNESHQSGLSPQIETIEFSFCIKNVNWDALCCYVLSDWLIRIGQFPKWAPDLVASANAVDQGEATIDKTGSAPFALFYALTNREQDLQVILPKGKEMVEEAARTSGADLDNPFLSPVAAKDRYSELISSNQEDSELFEKDRDEGQEFEMILPCYPEENTDERRTAKVLFLNKVPQSRLFIYWGRQQFDLLAYRKEYPGADTVHWSFTINPGSGFSLRGLGYHLEKLESSIRKDRKGIPRWHDHNYSNNEDPWYDGRSHQYGLVESPKSGTQLGSSENVKNLLVADDWHYMTFHRSSSRPVHLTYFFHAVRNSSKKDPFSGWKDVRPFATLAKASKILREANFKRYESTRCGCVFYASAVNSNVVIEVTPEISREISKIEEIPEVMRDAELSAIEQYHSALEEFPTSYFEDLSKFDEKTHFVHLSIANPDFGVNSETKIQEVLNRFFTGSITAQSIHDLKDGKTDQDLINLSTCVSFLFDQEGRSSDLDRESRKMFILYSLFIKSSYQQFSQRLKPIPDEKDEGKALERVLEIQKEFSRFLTNFDFVATELSFVPESVLFADKLFKAIHLKEQKDETNQEMDFLSHLANTYANESQKKRNKRVQHFIVGLAALAVCDFLYAFFSDYLEVWGITEDTHNRWQPRLLFTISSAFVFYCVYFLYHYLDDRKRNQ